MGNKKDLDADREVTFMEASRFAQENGESDLIGLGLIIIEIKKTPHRISISRNQCFDRRKCGRGFSEVYKNHFNENRCW